MEFGPYLIQIFASLALILGASLVALFCGYLKGKNEKLRELTLELKVRREESERLVQLLASRNSQVHTPAPETPAPVSQQVVLSPVMQASGPEPERVLSRAAAPAGREACSARAVPSVTEQKRISPEAMVAIVRGAIRNGGPGKPKAMPAPVVETVAPVTQPAEISQQMVDAAVSVRNAPVPDRSRIHITPKAAKIKEDWNLLLAARAAQSVASGGAAVQESDQGASALLDAAVVAAAGSRAEHTCLPSGLQSADALKRLADSGYKISGLAVSIAVTSSNRAENSSEFPAAARSAIESLLEPGEFAALTGKDEFLLLSPGVCGAAGQRRLKRIPQFLWDVQLGSLGRCELQFTWGGLEVHEESIQDALESAAERMQETHCSGKLVTLADGSATAPPFREAV